MQTAVPQWMAFLGYWAGYLYGMFATYWPQIRQFIGDFWATLKRAVTWIYANLPGIVETATKVAAGVGKAFLWVAGIAEGLYRTIATWFNFLKMTMLGVLTHLLWVAEQIVTVFCSFCGVVNAAHAVFPRAA